MGWFSAISTIAKVAHTASGLYLRNFGANNQAASINDPNKVVTNIGALSFIHDVENKKSVVKNNEKSPYYVYFSRVNRVEDNDLSKNNSLSSKHLLIEPNQELEVTTVMKDYSDGEITYTPAFTHKDTDQSLVSFTAEYILTDLTIFNDENNPDGNYVLAMNEERTQLLFTCTEKFDSFEISFNDKNNINFNLKDVKIDRPRTKLYEARVDLPSGCNSDYPLKDVRIQVGISGEHKNYLMQKLSESAKSLAA